MFGLRGLRSTRAANLLRCYLHKIHPPATLGLLDYISSYSLSKPRKILHIGANYGREARYYHDNGIEGWHVEAVPDIYKLLRSTCKPFRDQHPIKACLSSKVGCEVSFNIASNSGESSSLLGLGRHEQAYPSIRYTSSIRVETSTVDDLVASSEVPSDIDFLVIDAQGAELMILQGSDRLLKTGIITGAMIETAVEPLYEGGARYIDVCLLLRQYGLYLRKASFNEAGWCDAIFSTKYWP